MARETRICQNECPQGGGIGRQRWSEIKTAKAKANLSHESQVARININRPSPVDRSKMIDIAIGNQSSTIVNLRQ